MLIQVTVRGIAPIMFDRFHEGLLVNVDGPKSTNKGDKLSPTDQARMKLYLDDKDQPVLPADNLLKAIIDAGCHIKIGKRQLSTRDSTIVTGFLSINEDFIKIKSEKGWRVDARGIVNQATKGRHVCYRPIFDDWGFTFTLEIDINECSINTARELVDKAGTIIGIGVMRPARKGRYGKFKVDKWMQI
jgi:hypothetical protein